MTRQTERRSAAWWTLGLSLVAACGVYDRGAEPEPRGVTQQALDFVCPEGCTCTCTGGSGGSAGTGGSTSGPPAATCDLSRFSAGVWQRMPQPVGNMGTNGHDHVFSQGVAVDANNPGTVYLSISGYNDATWNAVPGGLFRTRDCGATWSRVGAFDQPLNVRVNRANSNELYVGSGVRGSTMGFWYSGDAGATWTKRAFPSNSSVAQQFNDVYHVDVDPGNFSHVLVSFHYPGQNSYNAAGLLESRDKGVTWTVHAPISGWSGQAGGSIHFLYDLAHGQGNGSTWLYTTQGAGMWRSNNAGGSWAQVTRENQMHGGNQLYYATNGAAYVGAVGHPLRSPDNGVTWQSLGATETGHFGAVGGDGSKLYAVKFFGGTMYSSSEADGANWTAGAFVPGGAYEFAYDSTNRITYGSMWDGGLWAVKKP